MEDVVMMGWVLIDLDKLINDVKVANTKFDDGVTLSSRLLSIGAPPSTLHDAKRNLKSKNRESILVDYPKYDGYGVIRVLTFNAICELFRLKKEKYIPKKKEQAEETMQSCTEVKDIQNLSICLSHIENKLDKLIEAVNTLGKVDTQNMEYLKNISDGIHMINEKWQ